jgi:hypothetical protein
MLLHLSNDSPELLSKDSTNQSSCHVKSLLSIVISIVFGGSSELCLNESVSHISSEESLLEEVVVSDSNMGQEVFSEDIDGELNSLVL